MTVPDFIRAKIFEMIQNKTKYPEIIKWVKSKGYSISKGGISYIKENYPKELEKEKPKKTEQKTEQLNNNNKDNEKSEIKKKEKNHQFSKAFWIAWDDILPSLESVFKQWKWKSKFNMIQILKSEIEKVRN